MTTLRVPGTLLVVSLLLGGAAFAGKPERDKQAELEPKLKAATKAINTACGCNVAFDVKWATYKKADDMNRIPDEADAFVKAAQKQCTTPADKKAFCGNLSSVEMTYMSGGGEPVMNGKKMTVGTSDGSYSGDEQLTGIISKW